MRNAPPPPDEPRRILVRGVNWLGDAVLTTPALRRLRERFPEAHLALLTHAKLAALWEHHPSLNETVVLHPGESLWAVASKLRAGRFDLALILPNSPRSALEPWLAGIPRRVGYRRAWRNWFLTRPIASRPGHVAMRKRPPAEVRRLIREGATSTPAPALKPDAHQIYDYLHLVAALGADPSPLPPMIEVTRAEVEAAATKFGLLPGNRPVFGLNPSAEYGPAKRWPADRFAAAAIQIQRETNCLWLVFGVSQDALLAEQIAQEIRAGSKSTGLDSSHPGVVNLAGKTTLRELCCLLKRCGALLTNDSGPMHIAAALGTPVIVPFGSTSPGLTGPGMPGQPPHVILSSRAPCSPCFRRTCPVDFRCMTGISTESVVAAVMQAAILRP